jgi:hypothetical protein
MSDRFLRYWWWNFIHRNRSLNIIFSKNIRKYRSNMIRIRTLKMNLQCKWNRWWHIDWMNGMNTRGWIVIHCQFFVQIDQSRQGNWRHLIKKFLSQNFYANIYLIKNNQMKIFFNAIFIYWFKMFSKKKQNKEQSIVSLSLMNWIIICNLRNTFFFVFRWGLRCVTTKTGRKTLQVLFRQFKTVAASKEFISFLSWKTAFHFFFVERRCQ